MPQRTNRRGQSGFSLLEMLIAVAILSAAAYVALDTVENDTGQRRYDLTELRLQKIRRAIVGDPDLAVNGSPVISGFVADVGQLPRCLDALVDRDPDCNENGIPDSDAGDPDQEDAPRSYSELGGTGVYSGWRGPYLSADRNGLTDGWGNGRRWLLSSADPESHQGGNWGWEAGFLNGNMGMKSLGRDRTPGAIEAATFDEDQYMLDKVHDDITNPEYAITPNDYTVDLANLVTVEPIAVATATVLCAAIIAPDPDNYNDWKLAGVNRLVISVGDISAQTFDFTENPTIGVRRLIVYNASDVRVDSDSCGPSAGNTKDDILTVPHLLSRNLMLNPRSALNPILLTPSL